MPDETKERLRRGDAVLVDLTPRGEGTKRGTYAGEADDPYDHRVRVDGDYVDVTDDRIDK